MKLILPLLSLLTLSACGFHPVYGVNKYTAIGAEERFEQIQIVNIPNREGQYLRNALIDRFYRNGAPSTVNYILQITPVREQITELDITTDADTTRGQLRLDTQMILRDAHSKKVVLQRRLNTIASYNILGSEFATRVSEDNTRLNTLNDLARQIEQQISLYFKRQQG